MKNKIYKITEPIIERYEHIFMGYQIKGNPLELTYKDGVYTFERKNKIDITFRLGDLIFPEIMAELIGIGLQPEYFTEEVKDEIKYENKKYRVIEPSCDDCIDGRYDLDAICDCEGKEIDITLRKHIEEALVDKKSGKYYCVEKYGIKWGDIVDFEQIEKWIEQGLQPIYFTEEVINLEYSYGYSNLEQAKEYLDYQIEEKDKLNEFMTIKDRIEWENND